MLDNGHVYGDENRCLNCDCRPWGRWAELPCGATEIPTDTELTADQFTERAKVWLGLEAVNANVCS